jgi:trimeric autotransporter adhesin
VTSLATWGAVDPTTAIVSNASGSQGLVSGLRQGKTSVYATYSGAVGGTAIPVGITSLALKPGTVSRGSACPPPSPYFPSCSTVQFTATGAFDDGTTTDVTSTALWSSSRTAVIAIGSNGLATYASYVPGPAAATITATLGNLTAAANITIAGRLKTR